MPFFIWDSRGLKGEARMALKNKGIIYTAGRILAVIPRLIWSSVPYLFWEYSGYVVRFFLGAERTLKLYFAFYKFRCRHNLLLGRERIFWVSKSFKDCVYKITYVNPADIKYIMQGGYVPYIQDGDWDLSKREFTLNETVRELFEDNIPVTETRQYKMMKEGVENKDWRVCYWCRTQEDIDTYFKILVDAYWDIKDNGYRTQSELEEKGVKVKPGRYPGEILLSIDRDGNYLLESGGSHRLSIVKLLGIEMIPAVINRKHYQYVKSQCDWLNASP